MRKLTHSITGRAGLAGADRLRHTVDAGGVVGDAAAADAFRDARASHCSGRGG